MLSDPALRVAHAFSAHVPRGRIYNGQFVPKMGKNHTLSQQQNSIRCKIITMTHRVENQTVLQIVIIYLHRLYKNQFSRHLHASHTCTTRNRVIIIIVCLLNVFLRYVHAARTVCHAIGVTTRLLVEKNRLYRSDTIENW